ncbi:hypothetical protein COX74_02005 [bacterium (Candidatus Gribaldobacteria) CG_4_10_14_0_2_um_filter_41_16]|uniref:Serine aminopeptidase S33 domain-containing protein n=3 Tax=Candidatus Gribaldobacteria TaxID=2798536 RepID=A0A2M7VIB4_9BACT|nr:MAG: hypothetical protein AUJ36_02775 [Parcubacteria group bacterium CG1_02_41_26]PIR90856.1 MAG: hypothetical protein COU03_03880 [bacterium (Candidatus Gribaldobacteria) CG10_big_fil_rev_8_21_14_0_10_41_12]PIV47016.1 MAG: hypothetical protein COS21_02290 [bacterium (Candidatus Gribaldobacteria) CG02_land_8_20_14_3_00_41_15]PJA01585.1 MAG: hypothetical protein COX74_02005 [bacterium (Candidatus Gribaldobacteria) CG_4_10_14_0_2_um_filter_41_16]
MKGAEPIFIDKKSTVGILMLHGFTSTPCQLKELADFLSDKGFTIYVPLLAGHGTSPKDLMNTTPEDWTNSVINAYLLLKQKVEKVVVVGSSFGGNLAFWLAQKTINDLVGVISFGAPIFLRFQWFIILRYYLYGRFKTYYHKPPWACQNDEIKEVNEVLYSDIPIKSLKHFLDFIKNETIPNLSKIKLPILINHAKADPLVLPKGARYIYDHIGSDIKELYWLNSYRHTTINDKVRDEFFAKVYQFIKTIT